MLNVKWNLRSEQNGESPSIATLSAVATTPSTATAPHPVRTQRRNRRESRAAGEYAADKREAKPLPLLTSLNIDDKWGSNVDIDVNATDRKREYVAVRV